MQDRVTILTLKKMKRERTPVAALSIYEYPFARLAANAGVDLVIVGDSLGMTVLGYENTLPVSMEEMLMFAKATVRGAGPMFVVGDLPLGAYQASDEQGVNSAVQFIKAGCAAVKCEVSMPLISRVKAMADAEILVMGHIGLNPQRIHEMGGHRIQGKTAANAVELLETAKALEAAGACSILLEGVTEEVAGVIRDECAIPIYGIASGRHVDGQLLIGHDPLAMYDWGARPVPKYIKQYKPVADGTKTVNDIALDVFTNYVREVKSGAFPEEAHGHHLKFEEFKQSEGAATPEGERIIELVSKKLGQQGTAG